MITEDYVSFEIAKLLKEKGFDEACYKRYVPTHKGYILTDDAGHSNFGLSYDNYSAPTLQMTMKWLREVHKISVEVCSSINTSQLWMAGVWELTTKNHLWTTNPYTTYEEACEAAIKYCLENLI